MCKTSYVIFCVFFFCFVLFLSHQCKDWVWPSQSLFWKWVVRVHMRWCVLWWLIRPVFAPNCLLQTDQVYSGVCDDDPLVLALHSMRVCSASQTLFCSLSDEATPLFPILCTLFPGLWWCIERETFRVSLWRFFWPPWLAFLPKVLSRRRLLVTAHYAFLWHGQSISIALASNENARFASLLSPGLLSCHLIYRSFLSRNKRTRVDKRLFGLR